ncbi:MAG: hypothetical protein ACYTE6_00255 [Planctomycetota bacterium]
MTSRVPARMAYVLVGAAAAVVVTWVLPVWFLQPSLPATLGFPSDAEAAAWPAFGRAETGYCFALNAVWLTAAVWLVAGGATLVRARVPARPSRSRRT